MTTATRVGEPWTGAFRVGPAVTGEVAGGQR
jgi:hypothetical protein